MGCWQLGTLLYTFEHSNIPAKIIIGLLVIGSIFSWSVMYSKWQHMRSASSATRGFLKHFRHAKHPLEPYKDDVAFLSSPLRQVYEVGARELCFRLLGSSEVDETFITRVREAKPIGSAALNSVRSAMEQTVGEEALKLESNMILLATAVSGAPFLGLLGTVWGVMDAFTGIAIAGNPQLSNLAPGVSGALLTTVAGLLVAIPAMFGYNFLITTIRARIVEMENFAAECASSFEHRFLDTQSSQRL
ncbi:MAG: MotA/TolQ/ExbB proton channel family protein [Verrucomicrobiota bacterium]